MKKSLYLFLALLGLLPAFTSCLNDDNEIDYSLYKECAISSFSISDIETTFHTTNSKGEDSTYTVTVTGSNYAFAIDQLKGEIYNVDSLPVNTDITHVVCSITADGSPTYQKEDEEWYYVSTSDSLDFTQPVQIRVWAYDGISTRDYTVRLNVHTQDGDSTLWNKEEYRFAGAAFTAPHAITFGNRVAVYGQVDGELQVTVADKGGRLWDTPTTPSGLTAQARYTEIAVFNDQLYIVDNGTLCTSADGLHWSAVETSLPVVHLLGSDSQTLYASGEEGFIASANGNDWYAEPTEYPAFIPDNNIRVFNKPMPTNPNLQRTLMFGQIEASTDSCAVAWFRETNSYWGYMYTAKDNYYRLPNLDHLAVLDYREYLIAFGGASRNRKTNPPLPLSDIYVSKDSGLTWKTQKDEKFDIYPKLPAELKGNTQEFTAYVDDDAYIWILFSGSGEIWRGRLNRMGFKRMD